MAIRAFYNFCHLCPHQIVVSIELCLSMPPAVVSGINMKKIIISKEVFCFCLIVLHLLLLKLYVMLLYVMLLCVMLLYVMLLCVMLLYVMLLCLMLLCVILLCVMFLLLSP